MLWWIPIVISIALFAANRLLMPKQRREKPGSLTFPSIDEGNNIPVIFGTAQLSPQVVGWDQRSIDMVDDNYPHYYARVMYILCWGPIDVLIDILCETKSVRNNAGSYASGLGSDPPLPITMDGTFASENLGYIGIDTPNLLGGKKRSGGLRGMLQIKKGNGLAESSGAVESPLMTILAGVRSFYKDYAVVLLGFDETTQVREDFDNFPISGHPFTFGQRFFLGANQPNAPALSFIVKRIPKCDDVDPDHTAIGINANLAVVVWEILTNESWGLGQITDDGNLDMDTIGTSAATLFREGFGVCVELNEAMEAQQTLVDLMEYCDGALRRNPTTGKIEMKLCRNDYNPDDIPLITPSNSSNLKVSRTQWADTYNEIKVKYRRIGSEVIGDDQTYETDDVINYQPVADSFFPYSLVGTSGGDAVWRFIRRRIQLPATNIEVSSVMFGAIAGVLGVDYTVDGPGGVVYIIPVANVGANPPLYSEAGDARLGETALITYDVLFQGDPGFHPAVATAQNLASQQALGYATTKEFNMPWITSPDLAHLVAGRRLRAFSVPVYKATWNMGRDGWDLLPGDVARIVYPELNINLIVRIGDVDDGTLDGGQMSFSAMEEVFDVDLSLYPSSPGTGWAPPPIDGGEEEEAFGWGEQYGRGYGGQP
jgi:hypothetical protein